MLSGLGGNRGVGLGDVKRRYLEVQGAYSWLQNCRYNPVVSRVELVSF